MPAIKYTTDLPVTQPDAQMRLKHTNQSVDYNLSHLYDHLQGIKTSLTKMATVNKPAAIATHTKAQAVVNDAVKKFDGTFHKSLSGVKSAPATAGGNMAKATAPKPKKITIKKPPLPKFATGKISKPKGVSKGLAGYVVKQPSIVTKNAADNMQY